MSYETLKSAGFSDAELVDYKKLSMAGFSDAEIIGHLSGGISKPEPPPMAPIEGTSPGWEVGQMPSKEETYPVVRGATQMLIGAPAWLGGSPIAGGALSALAGAGVDVAYGKMPDPEQVGTDAALGMAIPGGAALLGKGVRKATGKAAVTLYKSAAKYPTTLKMAEKSRIALAGLRERIMFNQASLEKLDDLNDAMTGVADEAMAYASVRGEGVPTSKIKSAFQNAMSKLRKDPVFGAKQADMLEARYNARFKELPPYMKPEEVLAWRRSLNDELTSYFDRAKKAGLVGSESAERKMKANVRWAVNEEIISMVPELKALGQRQKDIIDLITYTERATSRITNWDLIGLGSLVMGDITADLAGISPSTKFGALGTAAAGMLAWRFMGNPNTKARIAFALAKAGKLHSASDSTLGLIGLSREAARKLEPRMKALPFPRTMPSGRPDVSGPVKGGQEIVHGDTTDYIDDAWRQYADRMEGQFEVVPKHPTDYPQGISPQYRASAAQPSELLSGGAMPKMLADPGRAKSLRPEGDLLYTGAASSRARGIVESVRLGQMRPESGADELKKMSQQELMRGNTYASKLYLKLAKELTQ